MEGENKPVKAKKRGNPNLIPLSAETRERARELGRLGGLKCQENKRRRKSLKEELLALLDSDKIQEKMVLALIREATEGNNNGSVKGAFETIRDTIGEKHVEKLEVTTVDTTVLDEIESLVKEK